jgi:hypothetical protein
VKKHVKRMRKTVDYYNVILALPALYPYPPTDENTTGGPSSKYPLHSHRKKKFAIMHLCGTLFQEYV